MFERNILCSECKRYDSANFRCIAGKNIVDGNIPIMEADCDSFMYIFNDENEDFRAKNNPYDPANWKRNMEQECVPEPRFRRCPICRGNVLGKEEHRIMGFNESCCEYVVYCTKCGLNKPYPFDTYYGREPMTLKQIEADWNSMTWDADINYMNREEK